MGSSLAMRLEVVPVGGGRLRRQVLLRQMPLTITVLIVVIIAAAFSPHVFQHLPFLVGLVLHSALLVACAVIPWDRLPVRAALLIPLLDLVAVGFTQVGGEGIITGLGLLAAFPVVWIAASGIPLAVTIVLSLLGSLAMVWVPVILSRDEQVIDYVQPILLPLILTALAAFAGVMVSELRKQRDVAEAAQQALRVNAERAKQRERLLNTVLETVPVGLLAVDRDGHDLLMNARQRVNHSVAAPEGNTDPNEAELLIFDADRESSVAVAERPVRRAIDGEAFEDLQIWLGAGRRQRAFSVAAKPMTDDEGTFDGTVVSFTDITELQLALAAKDDFLSSVSHEFRTPLTSIIGYLEISLQPSVQLGEDIRGYLQVARRNALRLERLVEDLLAISAGKFRIRPTEFDLGALLSQSVASISPRAQAVRVSVTNRAPAALTVFADPVRMGQTVDNLLDNAVKYNRPGGDGYSGCCGGGGPPDAERERYRSGHRT